MRLKMRFALLLLKRRRINARKSHRHFWSVIMTSCSSHQFLPPVILYRYIWKKYHLLTIISRVFTSAPVSKTKYLKRVCPELKNSLSFLILETNFPRKRNFVNVRILAWPQPESPNTIESPYAINKTHGSTWPVQVDHACELIVVYYISYEIN